MLYVCCACLACLEYLDHLDSVGYGYEVKMTKASNAFTAQGSLHTLKLPRRLETICLVQIFR